MSKLSDSLRAHMNARGLTSKDVAATFLDELQRRAGERAVSWPTVEPKRSKLLAGSVEGEKFFFDEGARRAALAAAIGISEAELIRLQAVRTLFLHPGLPAEASAYLRERADAAGTRHSVDGGVLTGTADEVRAALKDRARRSPRSLVVLPNEQDVDFFEGADVRTSTVDRVPRGWQLVADRDLVALPPPPEPERFAGNEPLFPCSSLAEERRRRPAVDNDPWRHGRAPRVPDRCERADLEGREPTFTLAEIAEHRRRELQDASVVVLSDRRWDVDRVFAALHGRGQETLVWTWARRVFAVGPRLEQVRELLGGDHCPHPIDEPPTFATWRQAFDTWNPWASIPQPRDASGLDVSDPIRFLTLVARTVTECGLDLKSCADAWWRCATVLPKPSLARSAPLGDVDSEIRGELQALAAREHEVAPSAASVIFRLQGAAQAPLVDLGRTGRDRFHVVANMGAGHLLHIRCVAYPDEKPEPLRGNRWFLVGGDVTLLMSEETDLLLEADSLGAVRRRKREEEEEAAARRRRDDDDDD